MQKAIQFYILIVVLIVAVGGLYFLISERTNTESRQTVQVVQKEKAPQFFWIDFGTGDPIFLDSFRGRAVLLNYWAKWCVFCIREMPVLEKISHEYKDRGLIVLGIHRSDTESLEVGKKFAEELSVSFPLLSDGRGGNSYAYFSRGSQWMPTSVIVDREGFIQEIIFGERNEQQWRVIVERAL